MGKHSSQKGDTSQKVDTTPTPSATYYTAKDTSKCPSAHADTHSSQKDVVFYTAKHVTDSKGPSVSQTGGNVTYVKVELH